MKQKENGNRKTKKLVSGNTYKIGDELEVTAVINGNVLSGGKWSYENDNIGVKKREDKIKNPINIQLIRKGTCVLYYKIGGVEKASIKFIIKSVDAAI